MSVGTLYATEIRGDIMKRINEKMDMIMRDNWVSKQRCKKAIENMKQEFT